MVMLDTASRGTKCRWARKAFDLSYREDNFCNWCGTLIIKRLVHHGDGNPDNNNPDNLWALCGRSCHAKVHDTLLNGKILIRSKGGLSSNGPAIGHARHKGTEAYSERQRKAAQAGIGECKAKGARVANAKKIKCPDCDRIMNPGSLGMHKRVHVNGGG